MRYIDAEAIAALTPYPALIDALAAAFRAGGSVPLRHHHAIEQIGAPEATLLLMPAWVVGQALGVKVVGVFPGNAEKALPSVQGIYILLDHETGQPKALLDGPALTKRRTAAASALAARYLAPSSVETLLVVGTGALAPELARAHALVRPPKRVLVWGRNPAKAVATAALLADDGLPAAAAADLESAVRQADLVTCATLSATPLVLGDWLKPGCHLDLVGGFSPERRETDDAAIRRARLYVDTRTGALKEAGDIVQPLRHGIITESDIAGDLFDLVRDPRRGRITDGAITLFKSVGTALEDLAAARLAAETAP